MVLSEPVFSLSPAKEAARESGSVGSLAPDVGWPSFFRLKTGGWVALDLPEEGSLEHKNQVMGNFL